MVIKYNITWELNQQASKLDNNVVTGDSTLCLGPILANLTVNLPQRLNYLYLHLPAFVRVPSDCSITTST